MFCTHTRKIKGKLSVPSQIEGKMVTAIAAEAFKGRDDLVEVRFPATLERIGANAFESCDSLAVLYFGGNAPETSGDLGLNPRSVMAVVMENVAFFPGLSGFP